MATVIVIATTGDLCGSIVQAELMNLNPYDAENDVAEFVERCRGSILQAFNMEKAASEATEPIAPKILGD